MTIKNESSDWRKTLLPMQATIQEAIHCLDRSAMQIVLVVTGDDKLAGTLTDGDIRRAFLKGLRMDTTIAKVVKQNPLVVPPEIDRELVLQLMQANKIRQLPVVDKTGRVVGLHLWDSVIAPQKLGNLMVIMAGGKGTRLRPHTENCPKPMLEVGGKPMLQHIIERAKRCGFNNFLISLHYLGEMIESYFEDGSKFGVQISYLREDQPLGTAGCLSLMDTPPTQPFIVTNGDVLTDIRYDEMLDFHLRQNSLATMAVRQHEIQNQFGVVKIKGVEIEGFEEKPIYRSHVNAGIYVLEPSTLHNLVHGQHCDMPTLFERVRLNGGKAVVYPMHEPWLDVGRPEDLSQARQHQT